MSDDGDEFLAAVRAYDAEITEDMFIGCMAYMEYLFALPSSRRALTALVRALIERGAIDGDEVRAIVAAETVKDEAENGKASDDDATRLPA